MEMMVQQSSNICTSKKAEYSLPVPVVSIGLYLFSAGNDVLICGTCKSMYSSLATFVQHKKQKCELKTLCKCQNQPVVENSKCLIEYVLQFSNVCTT